MNFRTVNLAINTVAFALAVAVCFGVGRVHASPLGAVFGLLTAFVSLSAAIGGTEKEDYLLWPILLGFTLLGFYAGSPFLLWVGATGASIAVAFRAGWTPLLLGCAAAALALFGTLLAASAATLPFAFVFLMFGYGAQAALARRAPSALRGILLNLPLIALLRFAHPGPLLLALGLLALFHAAFAFNRTRDARHIVGLAGVALFAFGLGGAAAIFGGILQLVLLTLTESALFHARNDPWPRAACLFALSALPPSGLFASVFIVVSQAVQQGPLLAIPLCLGLLCVAIAMLRAIGPLPSGKPRLSTKFALASLHLALAFGIAFAMPASLFRLLTAAAS